MAQREQTYNIEEIVQFMQSVTSEYVNGLGELDASELLQVTCRELQYPGETSVPVEFEIACNRVAQWHKER